MAGTKVTLYPLCFIASLSAPSLALSAWQEVECRMRARVAITVQVHEQGLRCGKRPSVGRMQEEDGFKGTEKFVE